MMAGTWRWTFFPRRSLSHASAGATGNGDSFGDGSGGHGSAAGSGRRCGLLPGETVQRAQSPDEVHGVDAYDLPFREEAGDDVQGVAVLRVVEGGYQDHAVGDVEVSVARRKAGAVHDHGARKGQPDHVDPGTEQPLLVLY